jgi:hypothetical protein
MTTTFEQFENALRDASLRPGIGLIINDEEAGALLSNAEWSTSYFEQWSAMTPVEAYEPVITAPAVVPTPLPAPVSAVSAPDEQEDDGEAETSLDAATAVEQDAWLSAGPTQSGTAAKKSKGVTRKFKTERVAKEPKVKTPRKARLAVEDGGDEPRKSKPLRLAIIIALVAVLLGGLGFLGWNLFAPTGGSSSSPAATTGPDGVTPVTYRGQPCEADQLGATTPNSGGDGILTCTTSGDLSRWL